MTTIISSITTIISFLLAIGIIAMVHEIGHLVSAKWFGVGVKEFAIGFGKKVWGVKRGGTEYNLRLFPIAGFVELTGMDPEEVVEEAEKSYRNKSALQRSVVLVAGALMNIALAIFVWWMIFFYKGAPAPLEPIIGKVLPDGPAISAGLKDGDRVLSIDGQTIESAEQIVKKVMLSPGKTLKFRVESALDSGREVRNLAITPETRPESPDMGSIGIQFLTTPPMIGEVISGKPADLAGLKANDRVLSVAGKQVSSWSDMSGIISSHPGMGISIEVLRDGRVIALGVTPEAMEIAGSGKGFFAGILDFFKGKGTDRKAGDAMAAKGADSGTPKGGSVVSSSAEPSKNRGIIGIKSQLMTPKRIPVTLGGAFVGSLEKTWDTSVQVLDGIYLIFSGQVPGGIRNASGPVGIARMTGEVAGRSLSLFFEWVALLSTYIGIFNLLPFPALDGGRIFFIGAEVALKHEETVHSLGLFLLLGLLLVVTYFDIGKWVAGM